MKELLKRFVKEEAGLESAEYALLLVLVALAAIIGATALGTAINGKFQSAADTITGTN